MPPISCTSKARRPSARLRGLAAVGEGFGQQASRLSPPGARALKAPVLALMPSSLSASNSGSSALIRCDQRSDRLDLAVVRRAEDLLGERSETQHVYWPCLTVPDRIV
jgi:hypothetical protein